MEADSLQARIEHEIAALRAVCPRITGCRAVLEEWQEDAERRYAARLDVRWPQHQSLVSGPACASPEAALRAAFDAAARQPGGRA